MTKVVFKYILLISTIFIFNNVKATEESEKKGLEIATMVRDANDNFLGESSVLKMELIDAYGEKTVRELESKVLEVPEDGDKSLSIFLRPLDVKGTKMLTWSHKIKDDDQWLYLPSLRRVKRISARNKSSSFMGSEFSYEDMGSQEIEKYKYQFIEESKLGKEKIWIIDRTSNIQSGYSKQRLFISKAFKNSVQVEYFDRKGKLLKVASFEGFKEYQVIDKKIWRANKIHMKNVQTNKQSILTWNNRKIGVKHEDSIFNKRSLK